MTSVGVVSSVVERMKCLRKLEKNSGSLPKEAEGLLNDLAVTQGLLAAAYDGGVEPGAQLEKAVVRISYDVVYTITDALKPATGMFDQLKIGGGSSKLEKLKGQLQPFIKELDQKVNPDKTAGPAPDPDSSAAASPALGEAGDVQAPEDQSSWGQSKTSFIQKVKNMTDKVMNLAAGSDERPADQSEEDKTHLRSRLKTTLTTEMSKDDSSVAPSEKAGAKQLKTKESHQSAGQTIMNVGKMKPESTAGQGKNMAAGSDDMSGSNTNKGDKIAGLVPDPDPDPDSSAAAASPALTPEDQASGRHSKSSFIQKVKNNIKDMVMNKKPESTCQGENMAAGSDERPADQSEEDKTHLRSRLKTTLTTEMSKDDSSVAPSEKAGAKQLKTKESHQSAGQTIMNVGKMKPESTAGQGKNMAAGSDDMSGSNTNKGDKIAGLVPDPDLDPDSSAAAASPALAPEDQASGRHSKSSFIQKVKNNIKDMVMNKKPESTGQGEDMAAGSDERPADQNMSNEEDKNRLKTNLATEISKEDGEKAGAKESHQSAGQTTIMNVGKMKPESMAAGSDERPAADQSMNIYKGDKTKLQNRLKTNLTSKISKDNPQEMYIMGKSGMGKNTLARELYYDEEIRMSFKAFGWVSVGHDFRIKGVLQLLLQELGRWQEDKQQQQQLDLREMNEIELISRISDVVKDKPYLLVLEDICSMQDWENIRLALPFANSTCRVIITTYSKDFSSRPNCHEILGLTRSETLALLNKEADFDSEVGEAVAHISGGSPLYASILAKSLKSEAKNKNLVEELRSYESMKGTYHVLGACYKRLPPALKPCFLYLGQFPPSHDIPVAELYLLLAAEHLIMPPIGDAKISPQTLMDNLKALADLKLIRVEEDPQTSETGVYKTCRLHDQVREFCNWQGLEEEFHLTVDFERPKQVVEPHTHRLAIYMNKYKGDTTTFVFKENDTARKILSLLIFDAFDSAEEIPGLPSGIDGLTAFAHVRMLVFDEVDFRNRKLHRGIEKLNPLRFLSFRGCYLEELPSSLSSLKQLETLDLRVRDDCNVIIPSNVFASMKRMVHLYLPRLYQKKGKNKLRLQGLGMLETLNNFDTEVFEVGDLSQMKSLKDLSTVSNGQSPKDIDSVVALLNERKEGLQHSLVEIKSFDCYDGENISALRKLLQSRFVLSVKVEGQIEELPEEGGGGRLAEMFLAGSELEDDPMEYFGKFQNLRSLTLANDAFIGDVLVIPAAPFFPNLRSLKLQNLHYLDQLEIREGAMPKLSSLRIESCGSSLELTIPEELYQRLKKKKKTGGDGYSVVPAPSKLITTP